MKSQSTCLELNARLFVPLANAPSTELFATLTMLKKNTRPRLEYLLTVI